MLSKSVNDFRREPFKFRLDLIVITGEAHDKTTATRTAELEVILLALQSFAPKVVTISLAHTVAMISGSRESRTRRVNATMGARLSIGRRIAQRALGESTGGVT